MLKKLRRFMYIIPLFFALRVQAQSIDFPLAFGDFQTADFKETIENIVRIVIGFLGIIVIIIILYGGFVWMFSFGNEDKVSQAKKLISAGVIGLVIILAAYAIANFIIDSLSGAF